MLDQPLPAQHLDRVLALVDDADPAQTYIMQWDAYVQPPLLQLLSVFRWATIVGKGLIMREHTCNAVSTLGPSGALSSPKPRARSEKNCNRRSVTPGTTNVCSA